MKKILILAVLALALQITATPFYSFPKIDLKANKETTFCEWFKREFGTNEAMALRLVFKGLTFEESKCVKDVISQIEYIAIADRENEELALNEFMNQDKVPADAEKMNILGKILVPDHVLTIKKDVEFPNVHIEVKLIEVETSKEVFFKTYKGNLLLGIYEKIGLLVMEFYPLGIFFVLLWFIWSFVVFLCQSVYGFIFPWSEFKRAKKDLRNEFYYRGIERLTFLAKNYPNHKKGKEAYGVLVELKGIQGHGGL